VDGENLKLDLRVSSSDNATDNAYTNVYANSQFPQPNRNNRQLNDTDTRIADFTGDYERPGENGLLKLGFKIADNKNSFDTRYRFIDTVTAAQTPDPSRSNLFKLDETNLAVYGSYQMRLNPKWGVLGGLRVEHTALDLEEVTTHVRAYNNYLNLIPSFFATYKAGEDTNIRFSYAHRLRRPIAGELNPFVVYRDDQNVSSGNPHLKPMQTDSFELGYESRFAGLDTTLRGYYRKDKDAIVEHRYFISDTVLLTTRDNVGSSRANGLEFTVSGKITPTLRINTSGNLARSEQTLFDLTGAPILRRTSSLSLQGRVNWQATEADQVQFSVHRTGRMLFGSVIREPNSTANVSLRHALTPTLSLLLNVTDVFNSNRMQSIIDTDTLRDNTVRRVDGRIVYLGLSYRFGGATSTRRSGFGGGQGGGPR
jgi:outer membrane receptor protein involved in Fe transport